MPRKPTKHSTRTSKRTGRSVIPRAPAGDGVPQAPDLLPVFTVRTLAQAKILADPLRVRILAEFVAAPRTTKQVADRLGEPAPKLYRHVDALVEAGLLERKEERRKRGTTERYLRAVASRFEVDRALFAPEGDASTPGVPNELTEMVTSLFSDAQREFLAHANDTQPVAPILMRVMVRGSREGVAKLRAKLAAWLDECRRFSPGESAAADVEFGGLIAFYPVVTKRPQRKSARR